MYLDWGLEISHPDIDEEDLFYNPHCLSAEYYGFKPSDLAVDEGKDLEFEDWRYEERYCQEWSDKDWAETLKNEFEELVDAFVGWHKIEKHYPEIKV